MKIRYMLPYPFMMDHGGGKALETGVINGFKKLGHDIQLFDWTAEKADFEILLVFGFTQQNPQVLEWIKRQGIKIIMVPVFDRLKPRLYHRAAVLAGKIIGGYDKIRYKNLLVSDLISVNNRFEADDIIKIYKIPEEKIQVNLLGLSDLFFEKAEKVS